jgi:UbiD family decarboxylase
MRRVVYRDIRNPRCTVTEEFSLRHFLKQIESDDPSAVIRVKERVSLDYDMTTIVMELERNNRHPVVIFENVENHKMPVVANLFGTRRRHAMVFGVPEHDLIDTWANRSDVLIEPTLCDNGPIRDVELTGGDVDLARLPIPAHFAEDAGRYITNAIVVAKHPETGVRNASFHRMQVKGRFRLGTSLHSRRHLWNYAKRAEEMGQDLPIAIVIGASPSFMLGGLWKGSIEIDEYAVIGGFTGKSMEIVPGLTVPVESPARAEIVIEGKILSGVREEEGPFAEFTGYASERSTQHAVEVTAIRRRKDAIFHDIIPGISDEHTSLLAVPQEARLLKNLRQQYPNVSKVAYPKSGTCRFHAYVAMRDCARGQARNVAAAAFGDDLSLKLVVVVDDDVDVYSDTEVMWAMCTRMQADTDIDVTRFAMGAILDPSNDNGLTAKMVIDATRPSPNYPRRHTLAPDAVTRTRDIIAEILRGRR